MPGPSTTPGPSAPEPFRAAGAGPNLQAGPTSQGVAAHPEGRPCRSKKRICAAPKPREAMGQDPAREELAELLLDQAGQAVSVAPVGGFPQEGLQMFPDDGVQDGVLGARG